MNFDDIASKFPKGFPVEKLPNGAKEESIEVYRICRTGRVEAASFLPTYLDELAHTKENEDAPFDIGNYSLSTYSKENDAKRKLKFFRGKQPCAIVAKGTTDPSCGIVQRAKERTGTKSSHIDWWLYEGALPHTYFKEEPLL